MATEDDIVASILFDVSSGNDQNQIGGNETVTITNATYGEEIFLTDDAIGLDGSTAHAEISSGDMDTIFGTSHVNWAIAITFKLNAVPESGSSYIHSRNDTGSNFWALLIRSSGVFRYRAGDTATDGSFTPTEGKDYLVMMAFDSSDGSTKCWYAEEGDSETTEDASFTASTSAASAEDWSFGARSGATPASYADVDIGYAALWKGGTVKTKTDADFIWNSDDPVYWDGSEWLGLNSAPTVANEIPDQTAQEETLFNYTFPSNTFTDADGDTLTYTATQSDDSDLPSWITFDGTKRNFSGFPRVGDGGTLSVKVTADDGTATVSDTFDIVIAAASFPKVGGSGAGAYPGIVKTPGIDKKKARALRPVMQSKKDGAKPASKREGAIIRSKRGPMAKRSVIPSRRGRR